jgi:hypothetical protein
MKTTTLSKVHKFVLFFLCFSLSASCGGRTAGVLQYGPDADTDGAGPGADAMVRPDSTVRPDGQVRPDAGGGDWCTCENNEVYGFDDCLHTLELGCRPTCGDSTDCADGYTCETCAASSSCDVEDCRPTCVRTVMAQGPVPEPLRIWPTEGAAGQEHQIHIVGWPWYIGALYYGVRIGRDDVTHLTVGGGPCEIILNAPARDPGMRPIFVSQYGPSEPWVLAGFFTWSGGVVNECIQPGFHCTPDDTCCSTPQLNVTCQDDRCMRQP